LKSRSGFSIPCTFQKYDLVEVGAPQADRAFFRDQRELRREVLLVDVHGGVDGADDARL
jgi:hypothetical protein